MIFFLATAITSAKGPVYETVGIGELLLIPNNKNKISFDTDCNMLYIFMKKSPFSALGVFIYLHIVVHYIVMHGSKKRALGNTSRIVSRAVYFS